MQLETITILQLRCYMNTDNFFTIWLKDGSKWEEKDHDWHDFSTEKRVKYQDGHKTVLVCNFPIDKIGIYYEGMSTEMEVPDGCDVYKAMRAQATFSSGQESKNNLVGICIGLVKDDEVVEERIINILEETVQGWRK